jgi:MFS family permease
VEAGISGLIGAAVGIGASLSTGIAGYVADISGPAIVFFTLCGVAVAGVVFVVALVPETRIIPNHEPKRSNSANV